MKNKQWHLGFDFPYSLFSKNWSERSHASLLNLFKFIDSFDKPVLTTLPRGISPAGVAVAASIYFLPCIQAPPKTHCKIALYPGRYFSDSLSSIMFLQSEIKQAIESIYADRYQRGKNSNAIQFGDKGWEGALKSLVKKKNDKGEIFYHWIFRCQRVWEMYGRKKTDELSTRGRYARKDPYEASIDLLYTDSLDIFRGPDDKYDLLIYCPYYHSDNKQFSEFYEIVKKIDNFPADRKLIVARSPFDSWSIKCEKELNIQGMSLIDCDDVQHDGSNKNPELEIILIENLLTITEASNLYTAIELALNRISIEASLINDIKKSLTNLFASICFTNVEHTNLSDEILLFENYLQYLGIAYDPIVTGIIKSIKTRANEISYSPKLGVIAEICKHKEIEVWVTKDDDKNTLIDYKDKFGLVYDVRKIDRRTIPSQRDHTKQVVIYRIDRRSDIELVSYLQPGDLILLSSWEAIMRNRDINMIWEVSGTWKQRAIIAGIINTSISRFDPIDELAAYIESVVRKSSLYLPLMKNAQKSKDICLDEDLNDNGAVGRSHLLESSGDKKYICREIHLEEGFGIFVRDEDKIQVISEDSCEGDVDIVEIMGSSLKPGMTLIIYKDYERNSLFDILMEQLENSNKYAEPAKKVNTWKQTLRSFVEASHISIQSINDKLKSKEQRFELITIRSWIYGSTMAPMQKKTFEALVEVLGFTDINVNDTYDSVRVLRKVARKLGRILNKVIVEKDLDKIDDSTRDAFRDAGIDVEEISSLVDARRISSISTVKFNVELRGIKKIFRFDALK